MSGEKEQLHNKSGKANALLTDGWAEAWNPQKAGSPRLGIAAQSLRGLVYTCSTFIAAVGPKSFSAPGFTPWEPLDSLCSTFVEWAFWKKAGQIGLDTSFLAHSS